MYIQSCANQGVSTARYVSFNKKKRSENYFTYMSAHSEDIIHTSVIAGALTGAFSARKDITGELIPKVFRNIGVITLGLFAFFSLKFLTPDK